ncbi:MAG: tyrosine-type recombinase/integrase [Microthrixaceae bacterium]
MARRRQWGRIRKLPSGRYQARTPDEVPAPLTFTTKADTARWLAAAEADTLRGTFTPRSLDRLTLAEWLERWHEEHSLHKRPGTLARDRSAIRRHIVPQLGHRQLDSLRPADLQRFVAAVASEVGPGTTHAVYAVLRAALRSAADLDLIAEAPTRGVRLPPIPKTDVTVLRPEDLEHLAASTPARWRPMIYVAGVCGLRFAEIAGLRVGRLDLLRRQLHVVDTAPQVGPDRAPPKTASGRRTVPTPAFVVDLLAERLEALGLDAADADALVFTAARGGRLHAGNWHGDVWKPAREAAGFDSLRFHDLRHSAVPLWVDMGANLLQVSRWLGHSSVQITGDVYGHLFSETNDAVMARVDEAFGNLHRAFDSTGRPS